MIDYDGIDDDSCLSVVTALSVAFFNLDHSVGNCVWDLSGISRNGKRVSFEVKARSFESTKFGDVFAEDVKQECTRKYGFDRSFACNCFTDGVIAMADLYDETAKHFRRICPMQTAEGGNHRPVAKNCLSLPQTWKFKLQPDGTFRRIK